MSEKEEFEEWHNQYAKDSYGSFYACQFHSWKACAEQKNIIIEQQGKEIEALRGFAFNVITDWQYNKDLIDDIEETAKSYGLINDSGCLTFPVPD